MWYGKRSALTLLAGLLLGGTPSAVLAAPDGFDANGQCVGDADGDGQVTIDEIIIAVNNALESCEYMPVSLQFRAMVGEQPFECGMQYAGIGTTAADLIPSDFRFYVHNVRLVTIDGKEMPLRLDQDGIWQRDDIALLDFENRVRPCNNGTTPTNTTLRGGVPPGQYNGVRFVLSVPFSRNHQDQAVAPSPLNLTSMFWSWQDGYKFLRIDTAFDNLRLHVGSTGCEYGPGSPRQIAGCARPNRAEIRLDDFDPATNMIVADLAAVLADSDLNANQPDTPPGCMSDPGDADCAPMFRNLGINFTDGSATPATQKFFRVE